MKYQRSKTSGCKDITIAKQSLRQKLNSFDSNLQIPRWHSGSGLHIIGFNPIPAGVLENQDMLGGVKLTPPSKSHV